MEYPKLRASIELFPAEMSDQRVICLRDTLSYAENVVFLPVEAFHILRLFDGQHSLLDIQADFMRISGQLIYKEKIEELAEQLDENLFLESDLFHSYKEKLVKEYKTSPSRKAMLAGKSYPADPEQLAAELDAYFVHPDGPGNRENQNPKGIIKGAIIPHIDYPRGGPTYAWAYREIKSRPPADIYIILGTAHMATESPYILTSKDFETPIGTLKTNQEMAEALCDKYGPEITIDELAHRGEHSVELQAVFLKHILQGEKNVTILPVLCGSFHEHIANSTPPDGDSQVGKFTDALKECIAESGKQVCIIASADLSHMGPRFGDREPISPAHLRRMADEDMKMLRLLGEGDAEGFFRNIARDRDRRRICGFPCIYTMLKVIGPIRGELLKYSQWPDENATVTFSSMVFTR
jgi:hypothetical protein